MGIRMILRWRCAVARRDIQQARLAAVPRAQQHDAFAVDALLRRAGEGNVAGQAGILGGGMGHHKHADALRRLNNVALEAILHVARVDVHCVPKEEIGLIFLSCQKKYFLKAILIN